MTYPSRAFFRAEEGQRVRAGERVFVITRLLTIDSVLAVDEATQKPERLRVEQLLPVDDTAPIVATARNLTHIDDEVWAEGQRRFQAIKPLIDEPLRGRNDVEKLAAEYGVHVSTLYAWLKRFLDAGHVSALVPRRRGRPKGSRGLDLELEAVIASAIEDVYLGKQRRTQQDVIDEVSARCRKARIDAPHPNTVRRRISELRSSDVLRRRGHRDVARNRYEAIQGAFPGADYPLAVVQIDHTEADIILVDETYRKPIGRPWLTLAIDVYSRMVVGIYLSFEAPSAAAVGMCMSQAICPKGDYLAQLEVKDDWPVWGLMAKVHCDNAKEFRGNVLKRGCEEYGIDLQWRPVQLPHYGGHIERLMGTMANQIHKLPGTTFANPQKRRGYASEAEAVLTLREFETYLVDFIVNVYHQRVHAELGMAPRRQWEIGINGDDTRKGSGLPPLPADPLRIQLDFMPFFERTVQNYGIQIDNVSYYDPALDPYINASDPKSPKAKRQFVVRQDPRDISKIYFLDPATDSYVPVPYRNIGLPPVSAWELRQVRTRLRKEGRRDVDEGQIFEAIERLRGRVEAAQAKSKTARRHRVRQPDVPVAVKPASPPAPRAEAFVSAAGMDEGFSDGPIVPFDDVAFHR